MAGPQEESLQAIVKRRPQPRLVQPDSDENKFLAPVALRRPPALASRRRDFLLRDHAALPQRRRPGADEFATRLRARDREEANVVRLLSQPEESLRAQKPGRQ